MHKRSSAFALGAIAAVPTFDSALFAQNGAERQVVIVVVLAAIAIMALLVAGAAFLNNQRHRPGSADDELFTTTPLPLTKEELARHSRESPYHAFGGLRIPRWVQGGSLLVALGITWAVAQRVGSGPRGARTAVDTPRTGGGARDGDAVDTSPEDLDLAPDSSPAFAFKVRDWVARSGGGCAGRLEVTRGESSGWSLTARVHDGQGQLIDTARARVDALREGQVVEFSFPHVDCDRIGAWEVRGARRSP